jgi:hypothetical protein
MITNEAFVGGFAREVARIIDGQPGGARKPPTSIAYSLVGLPLPLLHDPGNDAAGSCPWSRLTVSTRN